MINPEIFDIDLVEQAMKAYCPSKRIDHKKVAHKYYLLVKEAVVRGVHMADVEAVKLNLIPVSFKAIRDKLGRYGAKGQQCYWFDWFQKNYPLMEPVIKGTNLLGKLTMIKTTREIEKMLAYSTDQELFDSYYADLTPEDVDLVPIDLDSLAAYIAHNRDTQRYAVNNDNHLEALKRNEKTAMLILTLAHYNNGLLPQQIVRSPFGRKYYRGPNLQSAAKIVRHAALGRCYQYDIEASVFTWKLTTAKELDCTIKLPATFDYLDYKQHHRKRLAKLLFENTSDRSVATIKQVITAVGFGARATNSIGWYDQGQWTTTAIQSIITSPRLIQILFADKWFREFVAEQDLMNHMIFDDVKQLDQIKNNAILQTEKGNLSRNKTISYLYQQAEASIIQKLNLRLQKYGKNMLLLCHDGFYTKQPADITDLRYELQQALEYGRLDQIEHKAYKYNPDAVIEEQQHRQWIEQEEQAVAELTGKPQHRPHKLRIPYNQRNDEYDNGYDNGTKAYQEPLYTNDLYAAHQVDVEQLPQDILELLSTQ
jgi:hypothetical protein